MTMPSEDHAHDMLRLGIEAAPGDWDAAENWVKIVARDDVRVYEREQHRLLVSEYIDVDGQESSLECGSLWQAWEKLSPDDLDEARRHYLRLSRGDPDEKAKR